MSGVIGYEHCDAMGWSWNIPVGLTNVDAAHYSLSALDIPEGYRVTVYTATNGDGESQTFTTPGRVDCLSAFKLRALPPPGYTQTFNDLVRSIMVVPTTTSYATTPAPTAALTAAPTASPTYSAAPVTTTSAPPTYAPTTYAPTTTPPPTYAPPTSPPDAATSAPATAAPVQTTPPTPQAMYGPTVRIQAKPGGWLNVHEIEVYDDRNANIAPFATVTSSSVFSNDLKNFGPRNVVDGTRGGTSSMAHTYGNASGGEWIQLAFPQPVRIKTIAVYNRGMGCGGGAGDKACAERILGSSIQVTNARGRVLMQAQLTELKSVYVFGTHGCESYPWAAVSDAKLDEQARAKVAGCLALGQCYDNATSMCVQPQRRPRFLTPAPTTSGPSSTDPPPTPSVTQSPTMTPAPTTAPPSNVPEFLTYPNALVVLAHAGLYAATGAIGVLTMGRAYPTLAKYTPQNMLQVFAISASGMIRNAAGSGAYLATDCTYLGPSKAPQTWSMRRTGRVAFQIQAKCSGDAFLSMDSTGAIGLSSDAQEWFILPVGGAAS